MTSDDALAAFDRNDPLDGEWAAFRERQKQATDFFEQLSGEPLRAVVAGLDQRIEALHDQAPLALPLARAALESAQPTQFLERLARAPNSHPFLTAITRLDALGADVWPLVERMLTTEQIRADDTVRVLESMFERTPGSERFEQIIAVAPAIALKLCWQLQVWKQRPLGALRPRVVRFVLESTDEALRIDALRLVSASGPLDDASLAALEALFPTASVPLACALAALSVQQAISRHSHPDALLSDARPEVRRAAFDAFVRRAKVPRSALPTVIVGWKDPDPKLRESAERVLREFCAEETLDPESLAAIVKQLEGRAEVSAFLAWVAAAQPTVRDWCLERLPLTHPVHVTLSAPLTRDCPRCRELRRTSTWWVDYNEPKALAKLERVVVLSSADSEMTTLLRCPECQAHFTLAAWSMVDVNSRDDNWVLTRLRFSELRASHSAHVDFTHPRLVSWLEAAKADLQHVDERVRTEAQWELSVDH